jgi:RHS repeat-associated protein
LAFSRAFAASLTDYDGGSWSLEAGHLTLNSTYAIPQFVPVNFQQAYSVPPVVVVLPTNEGSSPASLRIRNVTTSGFELVQVEADNQDAGHGPMTVPYVVVEPGIHQFPDGTWLMADDVAISNVQHGGGVAGTAGWYTLGFPQKPVVPTLVGVPDLAFDYDRNGNRIQLTESGSAVTDYTYTPSSNRLTGYSGAHAAAVSTDANGNVTAIGGRTFTHNTLNRIISVADGGAEIAAYEYNGLGQRIKKTTAQETVKFAYGTDGQLLGEYRPDGTMIREYVYLNGAPLAQLQPLGSAHEVLYLHTDHLGTPRMATDANAVKVWGWDSDPFGATAADSDPDGDGTDVTVNLRFPGQYFDAETGLYYNVFRYYDSATGRYLTSDPIGLAGGFNLFAYVANNPLQFIDPYGLEIFFFARPWWQILPRVNPPPISQPKPPGWTQEWQWRQPESLRPTEPRWFDPKGGEWRWHEPDKWHDKGHWDYNPWDQWNTPWRNIFPGGGGAVPDEPDNDQCPVEPKLDDCKLPWCV